MNHNQVDFEDNAQGFHIEHVADDYEEWKRPALHSSEEVKRMVENSCRAKLISQIVGAPDNYLTRDFTSSFQSASRDTDPPQFTTSHKIRSEPKRRPTIPTYPSLVHSLRWSPYVEMSSVNNSQTNLLEDKPRYNCRCESCSIKNCPSRVSSNTSKPTSFRDNIMTFSDRCTMTPKLNDACCGVCTPVPATPRTSDVCVPPDVAVRDTETVTQFPMYYQQCAPIPILKKPDYDTSCTYGYCGHATGHVPAEIRQEAVRDTDIGEDYCEPIKPKSLKAFFKFKKKPDLEGPHCMAEYGRKVIYNEGISDLAANNCYRKPIRIPSPMNISRDYSKTSVKSKNKYCPDNTDNIPFAHRTESRYHQSCKKSNIKPVYHITDPDEVKHVVESPRIIRKTFTSRPMRQYRAPSIRLPRKVLTSEAHIDSYIQKGREEYASNTSARRKKSKK